MARPTYTARPREALLIYRNTDGMLEVGQGRMRIAPGAISYFGRVTRALGDVLDLPGGAEAFARGDELGRTVTILPPTIATVPSNAWTLPDDVEAGTALGVPLRQADARGQMRTGTGAGSGSTIVFDPDDWQTGGAGTPSCAEVLLTLLQQANVYAAGSYKPPAPLASAGAWPAQPQISCRPAKVGEVLSFVYVIENPGPSNVFVMSGVARAGERRSVVIGPNGDAVVGTFIPPIPFDRQIAVPLVPLVRRLGAGESFEQRLDIPPPYAETSPWLPDPPPQLQSPLDVKGVVLAVGYWPAGTPGSMASKAPDAPGLYALTPASGASLVSLRFPTTGLQFAWRSDAFPRTLD